MIYQILYFVCVARLAITSVPLIVLWTLRNKEIGRNSILPQVFLYLLDTSLG